MQSLEINICNYKWGKYHTISSKEVPQMTLMSHLNTGNISVPIASFISLLKCRYRKEKVAESTDNQMREDGSRYTIQCRSRTI